MSTTRSAGISTSSPQSMSCARISISHSYFGPAWRISGQVFFLYMRKIVFISALRR